MMALCVPGTILNPISAYVDPPESVAVTRNVVFACMVVGIPVIAPVEALIEIPLGKPFGAFHVGVSVVPLKVKVAVSSATPTFPEIVLVTTLL
jgi:hypothetical protein